MTSYIPGTTETDPKKQNRAIQQLGVTSQKNQTDIATNATAIAALQSGPLTSGNVASKSDQQTGTSAVLAVTPAHQQDHDSAAKAWVYFDGKTGATATIKASYNVASVTRTATGTYKVTFTVPFASAAYAFQINGAATGVTDIVGFVPSSSDIATASFTFETIQVSTGTAVDADIVSAVFYGRQ